MFHVLKPDPEWRKTQEGRIVYDRKKHSWNKKDLLRIAVHVTPIIYVSDVDWDAVTAHLESLIVDEVPIFGAGRFSGAGATRDFGGPDGVAEPRIILLVEDI